MHNCNQQNSQNHQDSKASHKQSKRKIAQNRVYSRRCALPQHAEAADLSHACFAHFFLPQYGIPHFQDQIVRADAEAVCCLLHHIKAESAHRSQHFVLTEN